MSHQPDDATTSGGLQSPDTPSTGLVGTIVGNHRLVTVIGTGGMGTVYYAEHRVIGRRAAIKVLHPEVSRDAQNVSRFLTEARAANEIRHPNVVEITDIGQQGNLHYIVMSFLEGETLGERLERIGFCDEPTSIRVARQVASALDAAHGRGIVHRDLKPENIFLTNHPEFPDYVKLLDFGVAKLLTGQSPVAHKTGVGVALGTPKYMSPEQCRGDELLDHRSDIYSLGVVLYEMATGAIPFAGPSPAEMMASHLHQPPVAPIRLKPQLSPRFNAIIMRALEKDPDHRFQSMRELRDALAAPGPAAEVGSPSGALAPVTEQSLRQEAQLVEARPIASKLAEIIKARIASDRLVIPTMPAVALDCMAAVRGQKSFEKLGVILSRDPLMASRVLRLSNSAAFPSRTKVTSLEQAIGRMGTEGLSAVLVQSALHRAFTSRDDRIRSAFRGIWEHSLAVALVSRDLAQAVGKTPDPNAAYLAGLLHDIGKPVVATLLLEAEKELTRGNNVGWMDEEVWKRVIDECHRDVGVALAAQWKLPDEVAQAIAGCQRYDHKQLYSCANVVRMANALAKRAGLYVGDSHQAVTDEIIDSGRVMFRLPQSVIDEISHDLHGRVATLMESRQPPRR